MLWQGAFVSHRHVFYPILTISRGDETMRCGYGRVSSRGQSLALQEERLRAAGCDPEHLYLEKRSGTTTGRPALQQLLTYVRKGDVVLVTRLDRLARSTLDLCTIVRQLEQKEVELVVLDQRLDTSTPSGRLTFHIFAAVAQFETEIRAERQAEGIAAAKRRGVPFGHTHRLTPVQVAQLRQARTDGQLIRQLMARFGLSKASVYRYLAQSEESSADLAAD
jgi:DNA invertase Pin-like site-specific DNA recombinase